MDCYIIPTLHDLDLMDLGQGNRYFCLAHFYVQYPHYREKFLEIRNRPGTFITLDNSAAEKALVTEDVLISIVRELKPNEVIAPDVLFDKEQTLQNLQSFVKRMKNEQLLDHTKVFGCPQGNNREEWLQCYKSMMNDVDVSVVGLSKIAVPRCWANQQHEDVGIMESRRECVQYLVDNYLLHKPVHLLGMGDPTEYTTYKHKNIRSTDSCYTVLAAWHGIDFSSGDLRRIPTTNDFYDNKLTDEQRLLAVKNIEFLKNITQPGGSQ